MSTIKTSPLTRSLLAGASLALCGATAQAAKPTQADLDSIVLYGSTTIAQDSTSAWGIWDTLEPTASGPQLPRIDNFSKADLYRPLAQFTLAATAPAVVEDAICSGGSICGFGVFYDMDSYGGQVLTVPVLGNDSVPAAPVAPLMVLAEEDTELAPGQHSFAMTGKEVPKPQPLEQDAAVSSISVPPAVQLLTRVLKDGTFLMPDSGTLVFNGYNGYYSTGENLDFNIWVASKLNWFFSPEEHQVTWFQGDLSRYVAGTNEVSSLQQYQRFIGVGGITTTDADMSSLRANGMTATYAGYDYQGRTEAPNVVMTVDFGKSTVTSGSINGGSDGYRVSVQNTAQGKLLGGQVGVDFTATIDGVNFKSNSISAKDGSVKGSVTGAFYGSMASAAAGVVDIQKTHKDGNYTDGRFVSPFIVIKDLNEVRK